MQSQTNTVEREEEGRDGGRISEVDCALKDDAALKSSRPSTAFVSPGLQSGEQETSEGPSRRKRRRQNDRQKKTARERQMSAA